MKISGFFFTLMGIALCMTLQRGCADNTVPEKTLATATANINSRCPEMVDPETRLDSVLLTPEGYLAYHYTLLQRDKPAINVKVFSGFLVPNIINNVRTNPDLRMHRDSSVTMVFNYRDRNGEFVTEISIGPEKYR